MSFMKKSVDKIKHLSKDALWIGEIEYARLISIRAKDTKKIAVFDPAINSANMGDHIIKFYCNKIIKELFSDRDIYRLPTQTFPQKEELEKLRNCYMGIVCGTNLMTPHFEEYSNWKMPSNLRDYTNIITLGVGWGYYCSDISMYSTKVYNTILSSKGLHSVRDSYTEKCFREMGIKNVINTGCPTLWNLTEEHCAKIPRKKASKVISTVTDYDRNYEKDKEMLKVLLSQYQQVYIWLQGADDYSYLNEIIDVDLVKIVPSSVDAFTKMLRRGDIDYVGTRLHAGIHAMNERVRTIIISIDNRAEEMGKDFNLPIISRSSSVKDLVDRINEEQKTDVYINENKIQIWKQQFLGGK